MRPILVLLIPTLLFGCKRSISQNNEIGKIEFARTGAPRSDHGASISIDSSLNYKYWGDYGTEKQKFFVGKINQEFWDTLNLKLERIDFKTVKQQVTEGCIDCEDYELIIHWQRGTKHILRTGTMAKDPVIQVCKWLGDKRNIPKLKQIKDSIRFESNTHHTIKPRIKSIEFPSSLSKQTG